MKQPKKRYRKVMIISICGFLALYLGANVFMARVYSSPPRKIAGPAPQGMKDLSIGGPGHPIPVWATDSLVKGTPSQKNVFVLVHGYQGSRESWRNVAEKLKDKGQEVLVLAMRGHDTSQATKCSFGYHEAKEVLAAVQWARKQYGGQPSNIILVGQSLGTASCWRALETDPTINGIVSDSGFANLSEATAKWLSRDYWNGDLILKPMIKLTEFMIKAKMDDVVPEKSAATWKGKPALVIHGDADKLLDISHAKRVAQSANCPLWVVKGANHACCSEVDLSGYVDKLLSFAKQSDLH